MSWRVEREKGHLTFAAYISSGGVEYSRHCRLVLEWRTQRMNVYLPTWVLRPERKKVRATCWDAATIERLGRDWYWEVIERCYGCYLFENHFYVYLGRHTMDSSTTQKWTCFLPWNEWTFVRHSLYNLDGSHFADEPQGPFMETYDECKRLEAAQPKAHFEFIDFDGEHIKARCRVEESEWRRGVGWFKWLRWFYRPMIRRSLKLDFSAEVGRKKGSWKGGTVGHATEMKPGESVQDAFFRYCVEQRLVFVGPCEPWKDRERDPAEADPSASSP